MLSRGAGRDNSFRPRSIEFLAGPIELPDKRACEVYSTARMNEFVREVKNHYPGEDGPLADVTGGMKLDREYAQVFLHVNVIERRRSGGFFLSNALPGPRYRYPLT
jgi:hypothetical protein